MNITEKYKLIFRWEGIRYEGNTAYFNKAWFEGPVLADVQQLQPNDYIDLDLSRQNLSTDLFLPREYYIARLGWAEAKHIAGKVRLVGVTLDHHKTGSLKELRDGMQFFIDCSQHEEQIHYKNLVYPAWVAAANSEEIKK